MSEKIKEIETIEKSGCGFSIDTMDITLNFWGNTIEQVKEVVNIYLEKIKK